MKTKQCKAVMLAGALAAAAFGPARTSAQLLGNMELNQYVEADNDLPPRGNSTHTPVTDTLIPFQSTISANDSTGAYVTATYNISDNGSFATLTISASGSITANRNAFAEGADKGSNTTFNLLQACAYTATLASGGQTDAEFSIDEGINVLFSLGTAQSITTDSVSGVMAPGTLDFFDEWATVDGFNDPPQPANESGTYSLTLTFTAIPEPSCAVLLAMPAVLSLRRRRQHGR
jgi:hypothetical protein